jgi:hypothetical protein
MSTAARS